MGQDDVCVSRAAMEDFLYAEAALLDAWKLDAWLALLTEDAVYRVPSNDRPDGDPRSALFTISDDIHRIRARVRRLQDPNAHAESPPSRTRRMITNVRIVSHEPLTVESNFTVHRFRHGGDIRVYVGLYKHEFKKENGQLRIARREAILDAMELASLGTVSFIL
jgi:p-cumate 2,3-dioxygenase subunit beta